MTKGGYQILDFKDRNLTPESQSNYPGMYEKVEGTRKAVLLSGITISQIEQRDMFVSPTISGTSFVFTIKTLDGTEYTITIADTDTVTLSAV